MKITEDMASAAEFLKGALQYANGRVIWHSEAAVLLRFDSSTAGWGGSVWYNSFSGEPVARARGRWEPDMRRKHINDKEAQAFLNCLRALEPFLENRVLQPQGDSMTVNSAIKDYKGTIRSPFRNTVVREAWVWAQEKNCSILPIEYVNTDENVHADDDSRWEDMADWVISDRA